jgi:hypothetical protein
MSKGQNTKKRVKEGTAENNERKKRLLKEKRKMKRITKGYLIKNSISKKLLLIKLKKRFLITNSSKQ